MRIPRAHDGGYAVVRLAESLVQRTVDLRVLVTKLFSPQRARAVLQLLGDDRGA